MIIITTVKELLRGQLEVDPLKKICLADLPTSQSKYPDFTTLLVLKMDGLPFGSSTE